MENLNQEENFISTVKHYLRLINEKKKNIFFIFFFCLSLGIAYFLIKKPVYKTEMIVTSSLVTSERIAILVDPLEKLANEGNYAELSQLMKIDSLSASHITSIEAKEIKDQSSSSSTINFDSEVLRQQNCIVTLKIKSKPQLADTIQSGILFYLRSNNYINRKSTTERQSLEFMKTRIQQEIKALDSLKKQITLNKTGVSMMDPSSINNSIANLYHRELGIKAKIELEDGGINIIRDISKYKTPIQPKLWLSIFISIFVAVVLTFLYLIMVEFGRIFK